jgi:uncharacterized protein (TIGR03437 family)
VAGNGLAGYSGDGGPATSAEVANPTGIAVDLAGSIYITDASTYVRKIFPNGPITTIAGNGTVGYSGDGGLALKAQLNKPGGLALDVRSNLYIGDTGNSAVRLLQFAGAGISLSAVTNGASNATGAISPGELVVLYGSGLGPAKLVSYQLVNGAVPTNTGGTSVYFNGTPAPVLYSSATQVAAMAPFGLSSANAQVFVSYQGQTSAPLTVPVAQTTPSLFTADSSGKGQAAAVNQDGSINGSAHPASAGQFISLYATGFGQTNPPGQNGTINAAPLPQPLLPVSATIGGKPATIIPGGYAGGAPGAVAGVMQVNVQVPAAIGAGSVPVVLQVGDAPTQAAVTITVSGQ